MIRASLPIRLRSKANNPTATMGGRMAAAGASAEERLLAEVALRVLVRDAGYAHQHPTRSSMGGLRWGRGPKSARFFLRCPVVVTITRVAPAELDDDNLASAAKAVRDGVADALGCDDGAKTWVAWRYEQRKAPGLYEVRIAIDEWLKEEPR